MIQWILDYLTQGTIIKVPIFFSALVIFILCLLSLCKNFVNWLIVIILYAQDGWFQLTYPNFNDKIINIKYIHYVVNIDTGEIVYVNKKSLKKLKNNKLLGWNYELSCYYFTNSQFFEVKHLTRPKIIIWNK